MEIRNLKDHFPAIVPSRWKRMTVLVSGFCLLFYGLMYGRMMFHHKLPPLLMGTSFILAFISSISIGAMVIFILDKKREDYFIQHYKKVDFNHLPEVILVESPLITNFNCIAKFQSKNQALVYPICFMPNADFPLGTSGRLWLHPENMFYCYFIPDDLVVVAQAA